MTGATEGPEGVTQMPAGRLFRLGRCILCQRERTAVAPGVTYLSGAGVPVSVPACRDCHATLIRFVHQQAIRASLGPQTKDWR